MGFLPDDISFTIKRQMQKMPFFFVFFFFLPRPLHAVYITWKVHSLCWNRSWLCSQPCGCSPVSKNTEQRRIIFLPDTVAVLHHWGGTPYWSWAHGAHSWDSGVSARGWTEIHWAPTNSAIQFKPPGTGLTPKSTYYVVARVAELIDSFNVFFTLEIMKCASEGFRGHRSL